MRNNKRLSLSSFSTTLLIAISILSGAQGLIKVGVNQDMCNSASETTTSRAKGILDQINSHMSPSGAATMTADWTYTSLMESNRGINTFDVYYLGPGGTDYDSNRMTSNAAVYLVSWMKEGHGAVFTSHSHVSLGDESVATIMDSVMPVTTFGSSVFCKPNGANAISMEVNSTLAAEGHYLLRHVQKSWKLQAQCFAPEYTPNEGSVSVASFGKGSGSCHKVGSEKDSYDVPSYVASQGIMYREIEGDNGNVARAVWLCSPYCGYDLYQPFNLRSGPDEQIFANALEWASGLCRDVQDCNAHGSCIGKNTCACDPGYEGTTCSKFSCAGGCGDGVCIAGNTCNCTGNRGGSNCQSCKDGWHGKDCTIPVDIKDGNFTEGAAWWSVSGATIAEKKATFTAAGDSISQDVSFSVPLYGEKSYITFETSIPEGAELVIYINGELKWNSSTARLSGSFGYVNIDDYVEQEDAEYHRVKFVATKAGKGAAAAVTVTNIMNGYTTCVNPGCVFGDCIHRLGCVCEEHYGGDDCTSAVCGDGYVVYGREGCDDGNLVDGDGCSSTCQVESGFNCKTGSEGLTVCTPICGDGVIVKGEECDDGNTKNNDGCSSKCQVEVGCECKGTPSACSWKCGNDYISGDEECDSASSLEGCTNCKIANGYDCKLANYTAGAKKNGPSTCRREVCGDGFRTRSEECDNKNLKSDGSTGCTDKCKIAPGWECAESEIWGTSVCTEKCGNGEVSFHEECDDGNDKDGDGCSSSCKIEPGWECTRVLGGESVCTEKCGDGIKTAGEECDDGNTNNNDGCSSTCKKENGWDCHEVGTKSTCQREVCGDGIRTRSEECDDDNELNEDGCSNCKIDYGWVCDPNEMWGTSVCMEKCGNGIKTAGEECDDGNNDDGDGCNNNCTGIEDGWKCDETKDGKSVCIKFCGDGIRTANEACDDGNIYSGDGCSYDCRIEDGYICPSNELDKTSVCIPNCGDGYVVDRKEECDDGNTADGDGCNSSCMIEHGWDCAYNSALKRSECKSVCGNGLVSNVEGCDDRNTRDGDGCSSTCQVEEGWECTGEPSVCTPKGRGNGHVNTDEECDDGNIVDGDGCSADGKIEDGWDCVGAYTEMSVCHRKVCGDGIKTSDEECDDGNTKNNDGCSSECKAERGFSCRGKWGELTKCYPKVECGNGLITSGEECDDGNREDGDGCSATCRLEPGWDCKIGPGLNNKPVLYYYPTVCRKVMCGDGIPEGDEECDDGNLVDGDGCDSNCRREFGYSCQWSPSVCSAYCGNGVLGVDEECDDGNTFSGDGCSSDCKLETGWNYTEDPATGELAVLSVCGDGIIAGNEECDDGNQIGGDGCSVDCQIEFDHRCEGEPSVCVERRHAKNMTAHAVRHNLCSGLMDGEIVAEMVVAPSRTLPSVPIKRLNDTSSSEEDEEGEGEPAESSSSSDIPYVAEYKLKGPGYDFPDYTMVPRWTNLASGTYTVFFYIDSQLEGNVTVVVGEPDPLDAFIQRYPDGSADIRAPSSCENKDGAIRITTTGGTRPYKFYMGKRYDENGTFMNLGYKEFNYTRIVDANNCTFVLYESNMDISCNYPKLDKFMRDIWEKGGPDGVIILGVALAVIIFCIVCYWIWDWKAFKKDNNDEKKFRVEMERLKSDKE